MRKRARISHDALRGAVQPPLDVPYCIFLYFMSGDSAAQWVKFFLRKLLSVVCTIVPIR